MDDQQWDPYQSPAAETQSSESPSKPKGRPTVVTVFAVINLAFSAMGLLGLLMGLVGMLVPQPAGSNPVLDVMNESPAYGLISKVGLGIGLIGAIMLATSAVGLLQMRPWGLTLCVVYSLMVIVTNIINLTMYGLYVTGPLLEKAGAMQPGPEKAVMQVMAFAGFAGLMGLIYPCVLLVFATRPGIRAAFR